ncbi:hypothetical protein EJB05_05608 [Eragrostis curvula]|uniref:TF-B3 domain-containing protein n=1 Tax=Eragrostis curvula TaxID=38414 RepID=A0A5J9WFA8_9POAL|nr:hypothetical protein EJB05_05608 [Eragrostis curvula]
MWSASKPTVLLAQVIPIHYGDAYFPRNSQIVTLQRRGKNKEWHPKFDIRKDGSSYKYVLSGNWLEFVKDNSVHQGDICIFQPMKGVDETFLATVYLLRESKAYSLGSRTRKKATGGYRVRSCDESRPRAKMTSTIPVKEESFEGENAPYSRCNYGHRTHQRHLESDESEVFDRPYATEYVPDGEQTLILMRIGKKRKWKVKMNPRSDMQIVTLGWHKFVDDNHLGVEDIFLFQLMKNERRLTMTVYIIHHREKSPLLDCYGCEVKQEPDVFDSEGPSEISLYIVLRGTGLTLAQEKIVQEKVMDIQSEMPVFVATMNKNIIGGKGIYALDFSTLKGAPYLPDGKQTLTLHRIGWHRSWCTEMHDQRMLEGELCEFVRDSRLKIGDICLFEPVGNERLAMMVHIIYSEQYCVALSSGDGLMMT